MKLIFSVVALLSIGQVIASALPDSEVVGREIEVRAPAACGDPRRAVPLLRGYSGAAVDHFYTTNAAEMQNAISRLGYKGEGTTGYVFTDQQPATLPLYRLYSGKGTDHFYTTSATERDNAVSRLGYQSEGIAGFVYSSSACGGQPLYRMYSSGGTDHFYTMSAPERDNAANNGWKYEGIAGYLFPF